MPKVVGLVSNDWDLNLGGSILKFIHCNAV